MVKIVRERRNIGTAFVITCEKVGQRNRVLQTAHSHLSASDYDMSIQIMGTQYICKLVFIVPKGFSRTDKFKKFRAAIEKI